MIGRLALLILQFAVCSFAGPEIFRQLPSVGPLRQLLIQALVFAILVWLVGALGAVLLKDVAQPSAGTLLTILAGALLGAGLALLPDVTQVVAARIGNLPTMAYPMIGAVLGYALRQ